MKVQVKYLHSIKNSNSTFNPYSIEKRIFLEFFNITYIFPIFKYFNSSAEINFNASFKPVNPKFNQR